jgi:hypothetical protein
MNANPATILFEDLRSRGEAALDDMCRDSWEETLHLEFKTLAGWNGTMLTRDDAKTLGRALSGFSNAEGGILLVGIVTKKSDGLDVADKTAPIAKLGALTNRIMSILPDLLSPQHEAIEVLALPEKGKRDRGYLCINVSPSEGRPHMSIKHHQYFRRTSDGTRVMEHGEIRDLFFAPREARLELRSRVVTSSKDGTGARRVGVIFSLANIGRVTARNVYLRLLASFPQHLVPRPEDSDYRLVADGSHMFTAANGSVLHVGDEPDVASVDLHLVPLVPRRYSPQPHSPVVRPKEMRSASHWQMVGLPSGSGNRLGALEIKRTWGAENAIASTDAMTITAETLVNQLNLTDSELNDTFNKGLPAALTTWRDEDS